MFACVGPGAWTFLFAGLKMEPCLDSKLHVLLSTLYVKNPGLCSLILDFASDFSVTFIGVPGKVA